MTLSTAFRQDRKDENGDIVRRIPSVARDGQGIHHLYRRVIGELPPSSPLVAQLQGR